MLASKQWKLHASQHQNNEIHKRCKGLKGVGTIRSIEWKLQLVSIKTMKMKYMSFVNDFKDQNNENEIYKLCK